jgi:hypothetical protein
MSTSKVSSGNRRKIKENKELLQALAATSLAPRPEIPDLEAVQPVLSGEEAEAHRERLLAWSGDLGPSNRVECYLVEHAVSLSRQLDLADRIGAPFFSRGATNPGLGGPGLRLDEAALDALERLEGLMRYQQTCGRMLLRTLETIARLRRAGQKAECEREVPRTRRLSPPSRGVAAEPARGEMVLDFSEESAPEIAGAPAPPAERPCAGASADRRLGSAIPDPRDEIDASDDRRSSAIRARCPGRRQILEPGVQVPEWPVSRCPGVEAPDPRPSSARHADRPTAPSASRPDARRRVGGYAVPMDPAVPVSCADRIPVRLRRQAAGDRRARSESFPSP